MYVVARHEGEELLILDGLIKIKVLSVTGKITRIGIEAPREVSIERVDRSKPPRRVPPEG